MFPMLKTVLLTAVAMIPLLSPSHAQSERAPSGADAAAPTATAPAPGEVRGPRVGAGAVRGFSAHRYHLTFRGGELARISVIGNGASDLDVFVYDQNGNLIARDTSGSDRCYVRWTPLWTGPFTVRIVNRGARLNLYRLATN